MICRNYHTTQHIYTKHDKTKEKYTDNQQEMSILQSNAVNDNTDTGVRFTIRRRPHMSNSDAREMLYDVDPGTRTREFVKDVKLCNFITLYTHVLVPNVTYIPNVCPSRIAAFLLLPVPPSDLLH